MPSEPAESNFKNKVRTRRLPDARARRHHLGLHGPARRAPTSPAADLEANMSPAGRNTVTQGPARVQLRPGARGRHRHVAHQLPARARWSMTEFAHAGRVQPVRQGAQSAPWYAVSEMDYGTIYGAYRPAEDDSYYWRIGQFVLPFYTMPGDRAPGLRRPPRLPRLGADRRQQHDVLHDGGPSRHRPDRRHPRRRAARATA